MQRAIVNNYQKITQVGKYANACNLHYLENYICQDTRFTLLKLDR